MRLSQVAFVITCKGRLDHLKQSLPKIVTLKPAEVVVVDYDCPQGTAHWVEEHYPDVKIVKLFHKPTFNLSDARNLGAAASEQDWIFFADADILFDPEIVDWFQENEFDQSHFFRQKHIHYPKISGANGSCLVSRRAFDLVGGYDEVITGWGYEDQDFYSRLIVAAVREVLFERYYFSAIVHSDEKRTEFSESKNRQDQFRKNFIYSTLKVKILNELKLEKIPTSVRSDVLRQITSYSNTELINSIVGVGTISVSLSPRDLNYDSGTDESLVFEFKSRQRSLYIRLKAFVRTFISRSFLRILIR